MISTSLVVFWAWLTLLTYSEVLIQIFFPFTSLYYSLGSGSDQGAFYQRAGVSCLDMWMTYDEVWVFLYMYFHFLWDFYSCSWNCKHLTNISRVLTLFCRLASQYRTTLFTIRVMKHFMLLRILWIPDFSPQLLSRSFGGFWQGIFLT